MKRGVARALLLGASTLLALGLVELGLRLSNAHGGHAYSVSPTGSQYEFYRFDPVLGWANAPGMRGIYERDEFRFPIRVNALGMRDEEVEREPGARRRIAVLGDSFTWGIGVADEDRFTERLERTHGVEVLNFGVAGYGPVQYRLMLGDVLAFRPELVVVAFCLGNDFGDNVLFERYGYYKPWAERDAAGRLAIRGYPLPNVDDFGFREQTDGLVLARLVGSALRRRFLLPEQQGLVGFRNSMLYTQDGLPEADRALVDRALGINEALLGEIRDAVRGAGGELVLLPVPTKCEYSVDCRGEGAPQLRDGAYRALEATARRLAIDFVPTLDALGPEHFWKRDGHWRPEGHARIAERLGDWLEREGILE